MSVQTTTIGQGNRTTRLAALSGVVFVALLVVGFLLTSGAPATSASAAKIQHFYLTHSHYGLGAFLIVLSVAFGLFFFGHLRAYFRAFPGVEWLSSIFFAGAIVFGVAGAVSAGLAFALADHPKALSAQSLQLLNTLESNLSWPFLSIGLTVLYAAAALIIYRSRALPVWLAWASGLLGLLAASEFLAFISFIGTAAWVLYVSVTMASRNPSLGVTTIALPDAAATPAQSLATT